MLGKSTKISSQMLVKIVMNPMVQSLKHRQQKEIQVGLVPFRSYIFLPSNSTIHAGKYNRPRDPIGKR